MNELTTHTEWLSMDDVARHRFVESVWIPLWGYEIDKYAKSPGLVGKVDECRAYNTLLVETSKKREVMKYDIADCHPLSDRYAVIGTRPYYSSNVDCDGDDIMGTFLVVKRQYMDGEEYNVNIDQDLIMDLRLKREGDVWVRPCEAYREVMRLRRNEHGQVALVEIKAEYLKDWLCARKMGLASISFVQRQVLTSAGDKLFAKASKRTVNGAKIESWTVDCDDKGHAIFGDWEESICAYDDVHPDVDVPVYDLCKDHRKIRSSRRIIKAKPVTTCLHISELRRTEWIAPSRTQRRMPFDCDGDLSFICEADGRTKKAHSLIHPARYLWFKNSVLKEWHSMRSGKVQWLTQETGLVKYGGEPGVHFGINKLGHVNVFAKDIAECAWWKQEIWRSYNVAPEGGVSEELTDSQQRCEPARTHAPEALLYQSRKMAFASFLELTHGEFLFENFDDIEIVGNSIQRFNVQSQSDVYLLAKQITRLMIESLNQTALRKMGSVGKGEKLGSLKCLERALIPCLGKEEAYKLLSPLHAIYTLRLADAHNASRETKAAMDDIGISPGGQLIRQGGRMIFVAAKVFHDIAKAFLDSALQKSKEVR